MSDEFPAPEVTAPLDELLSDEMPNHKAGKPPWWKFGSEKEPRSESDTASTPRKPRGRPKGTLREPKGGLKKALIGFYGTVAMGLMPFDQGCAKLWMDNAENCAETMAEWADANPAVKRVLIQMVTVSAFGKVVAAHSPILMGMAFHHIPALREKQEAMVANMAEEYARFHANGREQ